MNEEPIDKFEGEFRFLSNFYPAPVKLDGVVYPSVEHAYQAAKTTDLELRKKFLHCSAAQAKKMGRKVPLREGWEKPTNRLTVMRGLLEQKFAPGTQLSKELLATDSRPLIEGNWWGDRFWGMDGQGLNWLGKLLEDIRTQLLISQMEKARKTSVGPEERR